MEGCGAPTGKMEIDVKDKRKKERQKNQGGCAKWQSRADNGCCHPAVTLSNLKEQRSLETRRGAVAAASCTIHPNNQFHFFLLLPLLTLPHSFLLTPPLMSPLWSYSSITDGGYNDVCQRGRTHTHTHTQSLDLSFHRQLAHRSQSPVRWILINWLLVDVRHDTT